MENKIELLRKQNGISQGSLVKEMRVSRQTISSIENGEYNLLLGLVFAIADYFGMNIEEIFTYDRRYNHEKATRI